jgi:hypothetical protein
VAFKEPEMQRQRPIDELPQNHTRLQSGYVFNGVDDNGIEFELRYANTRRQVSSSEMVKAQINAMRRGRPMTSADIYKEEPSLTLFIAHRRRVDIRINPNMTYSVGRDNSRTLKGIVEMSLRPYAPRPSPPGP